MGWAEPGPSRTSPRPQHDALAPGPATMARPDMNTLAPAADRDFDAPPPDYNLDSSATSEKRSPPPPRGAEGPPLGFNLDSPPQVNERSYEAAEATDLRMDSPRTGYDPSLCCTDAPSPGPAYGHPSQLGHIRALLARDYRSEPAHIPEARGGLNLTNFDMELLRSRPEATRGYEAGFSGAHERSLLAHGYRRARQETASHEPPAPRPPAAAVYDFTGAPSPERLASPPGRWPV